MQAGEPNLAHPALPHSYLWLSSPCCCWILGVFSGYLCFSCSALLLTSAQRPLPTARAVRKFWGKEDPGLEGASFLPTLPSRLHMTSDMLCCVGV